MTQESAAANKLNRELLRWIQSLDLAYSIKNVKRDFSNGFLVAEIMSRYYDKDVSMHSYDNGIGIKVKKDNWDQLHKIFSRVSDLEPLTSRVDIEAVIHCQNGAAVAFLTKLYQCLTKRTIQPIAAPSAAATGGGGGRTQPTPAVKSGLDPMEDIPPYAKPTGTALIREKMRAPDIAETNDETEINRKVRNIHAQHEENLQLERLMSMDTPDRYPSLRNASKATVLRGATKPVRNDETPMLMTQQVVKEVQIKSMNEKSLEKLRMNREAKDVESPGNGGGGVTGGVGATFEHFNRSGVYGLGGGGASGELIQKRRPLDLLNDGVVRRLSPVLVSKLDQRGRDKFYAFLDALHDGRLVSDQEGADLLVDIVDDPNVLAQAFMDFPKDFWKFVGAMTPLLTENDEIHPLFVAVHLTLVRIGSCCVERDGSTSMLLMMEYFMPKLPSLVRSFAAKRAPLVQIAYSFVPSTVLSHIQVIKRLRETFSEDIPLFIHLLSILLYTETQLDDTLVDLYHYYCCIGLETPCEKLRAACLSMLVPFMSYDITLVIDLLPRLTQFSSRHSWWEVKTQLLIVAAAFLHHVATTEQYSRDYTEQIELALTIIEREFHLNAHLNVRRVGLAYLAKDLAHYQELVPLYVDVLLSIPSTMRSVILQTESQQPETAENEANHASLPIRGTSGAHYRLSSLPEQWDSMAIAKQIFYERKSAQEADFDSMQVLLACVTQLASTADGTSQLQALYEQMRGYIVLGLLDAAACGSTAQILVQVTSFTSTTPSEIIEYDGLIDTLVQLVSRNVEDLRQQIAIKMLHDIRTISPRHAAAVQRCVEAVHHGSDATTFNASLFAAAL
ncbi:hypothetical protein Poli38472_005714 [Pythium oligandrum]|uniref:Spermatogenesis-associated protein 4 n=1 Tax=Pythium oligandrum TaxID=41045 RepID=A0A8K1CTB8_PYTOL|nr:hypothetical protein Poli38472_005714 [Pythium oligandrum]|eukprot:TMW68246.1 hypothetical protein Poli38472_005714 [Pythium oligandrum]